MPAVLIDTNLLMHALDPLDNERQDRAIRVLHVLQATGAGRLSVQCLAEFASATTRRLHPLLTRAEAFVQVERLAQAFRVYDATRQIVIAAARGARDHKLTYYAAQMSATALLNQLPVMFSEDFASGANLEGVRLVNPFADEFVLEEWE